MIIFVAAVNENGNALWYFIVVFGISTRAWLAFRNVVCLSKSVSFKVVTVQLLENGTQIIMERMCRGTVIFNVVEG